MNELKKMGKKVLCLAAVAGLLLGAAPKTVSAAEEAQAPSYAGGIRLQNLEFIGAKAGWVLASTTAKQIATGVGVLYAICPEGGTVGKYSMAFDSALSGVNGPTVDSISAGYALSQQVPVLDSTQSGYATGANGCWIPRVPVQFTNGLSVVQNSALHNTLVLYRLTGASVQTNP